MLDSLQDTPKERLQTLMLIRKRRLDGAKVESNTFGQMWEQNMPEISKFIRGVEQYSVP